MRSSSSPSTSPTWRTFAVVRTVRDEFIDTARPPASTAVQVVALARPELLLEAEAFALVSRS